MSENAEVKPGKDTTEHEQTKKADTMAIVGMVLAAVIAYAPKVIEGLNGESKWAIIAGGVVGVMSITLSTLTKLGYIQSRTAVKVAAEKAKVAEPK